MLFRDRYNYDSSLNNFKTNILSKITKPKHSEKWKRKAFSWNFLFKNQFTNNENVFIHFHENFAQQRSAVDGKRINLISRKTEYFVKKTPFCKVRLDFDFCFGSINLSKVNTFSERVTFTNFTRKLSFRISAYHSAQPNSIF